MNKPTEKQKIGWVGEDIAVKYLKGRGFLIVGRNYLKRYGEIDIIAQKGKITHFIEVKTVSRENKAVFIGDAYQNVTHETDTYRPEDNIHAYKLKRLARTIQAYILEKFHDNNEPDWEFDVITIQLDNQARQAQVKFIENLIL